MTNKPKFLILGAGQMGTAIGHFIEKGGGAIAFVDVDRGKLEAADKNVRVKWSSNGSRPLARDADCVISALPAIFNVEWTVIAAKYRKPFIDLGGVQSVVDEQKKIKSAAPIIPHCGLAPGLVPMLGYQMYQKYKDQGLRRIELFCGGISEDPGAPLGWIPSWSAEGLINEYTHPVEVMENGYRLTCAPLGEREMVPVGGEPGAVEETFECALTHGGLGNLLDLVQGISVSYRTLRWEGHYDLIDQLGDLKAPTARRIIEEITAVNKGEPDMVVIAVCAYTDYGSHWFEQRWYGEDGLSAMQRLTAASAAAVALKVTARSLRRDLEEYTYTSLGFTPVERIWGILPLMSELGVPVNFYL